MKKNTKAKKQVIVVPTTQKIPKNKSLAKPRPIRSKPSKTNTLAYYNCLLTSAQNNWFDPTTGKKNKITTCCKNCKLNAPALNEQKTQEVKKLILSYQQVGDSLKKLLKPIE